MAYFVVRYDVTGMAEDPENPGHAVPFMNGNDVVAPQPLEPSYDTIEAAIAASNELSGSNCDEEVELTLANGKPYKGPRYIYRIGQG